MKLLTTIYIIFYNIYQINSGRIQGFRDSGNFVEKWSIQGKCQGFRVRDNPA